MLPQDLEDDFLDSNIDSDATDRSGDWTIDNSSSSKTCQTESVCNFSVRFSRLFQTDDADDY